LEVLRGFPPYTIENKGFLIRNLTNENNVYHSVLVCDFMPKSIMPFAANDEYADILNRITGRDKWRPEDLEEGAARGENLTRLFNYREGFNRDDDTLPDRVFEDTTPQRAESAQRVTREHLETMKDEYYFYRGWDINGVPDVESLLKLGMDEYVQDATRMQAEQAKRTGRSGMPVVQERRA
jgi:aldehyde:ferredoxin oxidoreductase